MDERERGSHGSVGACTSVNHPITGRWGSSGSFERGEQEQWLEDAAAGRRTDGVREGEPWL
jgi:hypothetical protein